MPKQIDIQIKETEQELVRMHARQDRHYKKQRIKALLLIKQGKVTYTYELARKLKMERKTIYTWLERYKKVGIDGFLTLGRRGAPKSLITPEIRQSLKEKPCQTETTMTSYMELIAWVEETYAVKLKYKSLYNHCRRNLNRRLKVSRKSHHKKSPEAESDFKKIARDIIIH